jgi:hypothetical protein
MAQVTSRGPTHAEMARRIVALFDVSGNGPRNAVRADVSDDGRP